MDPHARPGRTTKLISTHPLPELGPEFIMVVGQATYAPGTSFPPHIHRHSTYSLVLAGEITIGLQNPDGTVVTRVYRAGESWSEPAGVVHAVTENRGTKDAVWVVHTIIEKGKDAFYLVDERGARL